MKIWVRDEEVDIEVDWFSEFPRGEDGACALCHGDPCGEYSGTDSNIYKIMHEEDGSWSGEDNCPVCEGRPT